MTIQTVDFTALEQQLDAAIAVIEAHGLKPSRGRIGRYRTAIQQLAKARRNNTWEELNVGFPEAVTTLYEIMDLLEICAAPGLADDPKFGDLCKKVLKGPEEYTGEKAAASSNEARNYAFQLLIAAKMHRAGIENILEKDADICVRNGVRRCLIEAKRIQSENKLERRCKEARDQLTATLRKFRYKWSTGIVAIDITKLVNENFDLLVKKNEPELMQILAGLMPGFSQQYSGIWANWDHPRIGGILAHTSIMAVVEDKGLLVHCREFGLLALDSANNRTRLAMSNLATNLNASRVLLAPRVYTKR